MDQHTHRGSFAETQILWTELEAFTLQPFCQVVQTSLCTNSLTRKVSQDLKVAGGCSHLCRYLLLHLKEGILHIQASQDGLLTSKLLLRLLPKIEQWERA